MKARPGLPSRERTSGDTDPTSDLPGRAWPRRLGVSLVFAASMAVMLRPTWYSLTRTVPNLGDPALNVWFYEWGRHALLSDPIHVFDANIFWPHPLTLAYSENMLLGAIATAPVRWLGGSWALGWNSFAVACLALSLGATYSLVRYLVGRTDAAVIAAFAFTYGAFVTSHLVHAQLLTLGLFPLGLLLLLRTLDERRIVLAVGTGLTTGCFVIGSMYYAAIWGLVAAVVVVGYLVAARFRPGPGLVRPLLVTGLVAGFVALPVAIPYLRLQREENLTRATVPEWGLNPRDLLTPAPGAILERPLDEWAEDYDTRWEHAFYPGLVVLALAAAGLVVLTRDLRRRGVRSRGTRDRPAAAPADDGLDEEPPPRRAFVLLVALAGLVAFAVAAGPTVLGFRYTPFRALYHLAPGFNGVRVAARLAVPGLLALVVMAAYGYRAASRPLRPRGRGLLAVAVGGFVLLELAVSFTHVELPDDSATLAVYHALARKPAGPVVELPIAPVTDGTRWADLEAPRMLYSSIDWNPRVNGYSGYWPPGYTEDVTTLNRFPEPAARDRLRALGVRYVVLHVGEYAGFQQLTEEQARSMAYRARAEGARVERIGNAWLVDLGRGASTSGRALPAEAGAR